MMKYEQLTFDDLGTQRQRPMMVSEFIKFRRDLWMKNYPTDPHKYKDHFLFTIDNWINSHRMVRYKGLDSFPRRDVIIGTTHQLDELHMKHGPEIVTFRGEYKYHRRLTDYDDSIEIDSYKQLLPGHVLIMSYPSCITTNRLQDHNKIFERCSELNIPIHIDGAWFGQCRNFELDVTHPQIKSVSVSLSKALGMGSQRIGIRYTRERVNGPISIMNDYDMCNVSDMWIGVNMMEHFGPDYWWLNYKHLYEKVINDFQLEPLDSFHIANKNNKPLGIRTPLRMLIDGIYDERGTDKGLNKIEREERQ